MPDDTNWLQRCVLDEHGKPIPNVSSALTALACDPDVRDVFAFDEMLRAPMMQHEIGRLDICDRAVTDEDVTDLQRWMQDAGLKRIGRETVRDAMFRRAKDRSFHPVRRYVHSLQWDRTPRIGSWLPRYLGADFNPYTMQHRAHVPDVHGRADRDARLQGRPHAGAGGRAGRSESRPRAACWAANGFPTACPT